MARRQTAGLVSGAPGAVSLVLNTRPAWAARMTATRRPCSEGLVPDFGGLGAVDLREVTGIGERDNLQAPGPGCQL